MRSNHIIKVHLDKRTVANKATVVQPNVEYILACYLYHYLLCKYLDDGRHCCHGINYIAFT